MLALIGRWPSNTLATSVGGIIILTIYGKEGQPLSSRRSSESQMVSSTMVEVVWYPAVHGFIAVHNDTDEYCLGPINRAPGCAYGSRLLVRWSWLMGVKQGRNMWIRRRKSCQCDIQPGPLWTRTCILDSRSRSP